MLIDIIQRSLTSICVDTIANIKDNGIMNIKCIMSYNIVICNELLTLGIHNVRKI